MNLKDLLKNTSFLDSSRSYSEVDSLSPVTPSAREGLRDDSFYLIKQKIHTRLVEEANLAALDTMSAVEIRESIASIVKTYLGEEKILLNSDETNALIIEINDELTGLGPLEPFFKDPTVSDVDRKSVV